MPEPTPRKFTMADLMILIAGCAVGIAWTRSYHASMFGTYEGAAMERIDELPIQIILPVPLLAMMSVALLVCRLRGPRPKLRRLFRQPGAVATASVLLPLAYSSMMMLAGRVVSHIVGRFRPPSPVAYSSPPGVIDTLRLLDSTAESGIAVALCWLLLLAVGRWRPEPDWVDRSGRCLGACWIALEVARSLVASLIV